MDDAKNEPPKGEFNWQYFRQFFGKDFPFQIPDNKDDFSWIEKYVGKTMDQFLPKPLHVHSQTKNYRMEMFETHKNLIVKLHLSEKEARNVSVFAGVNRIKLDGYPENSSKIIKLTTYVVPESCVAVYKNGILQLHMRKQAIDDYIQEVNIKFPK